jgi:hypothetical protein
VSLGATGFTSETASPHAREVLALSRLLRGVNKTSASLMVALVLVSAAVGFMNVLNHIAALTLFRGADFLAILDKPQRDALGMLFIRLHGQCGF